LTKITLFDDLSIFINTSDSYLDAWNPFFTLFKKYWPECSCPIFLNTEVESYNFPGLNIISTQVAKGEDVKLTWSECFERGLAHVKTPYILYLQEDYFLERAVRVGMLEQLLDEMRSQKADSILLQRTDSSGKDSDLIWEISKSARFRISLQAGLWKKSILQSQIRKHESPWQFESYGSSRSRRLKEKLFSVNLRNFTQLDTMIFPYKRTGIVAGKWVREIVEPLFSAHEISVDFSLRGFHDKKKKFKRKSFFLRAIDRLRSIF
jgi:hypothetical protein